MTNMKRISFLLIRLLLVAAVTDELIGRGLSADDIVRQIAKIVDGSGGGKEHLAQAGGKNPEKLPEALAAVEKIVAAKIG